MPNHSIFDLATLPCALLRAPGLFAVESTRRPPSRVASEICDAEYCYRYDAPSVQHGALGTLIAVAHLALSTDLSPSTLLPPEAIDRLLGRLELQLGQATPRVPTKCQVFCFDWSQLARAIFLYPSGPNVKTLRKHLDQLSEVRFSISTTDDDRPGALLGTARLLACEATPPGGAVVALGPQLTFSVQNPTASGTAQLLVSELVRFGSHGRRLYAYLCAQLLPGRSRQMSLDSLGAVVYGACWQGRAAQQTTVLRAVRDLAEISWEVRAIGRGSDRFLLKRPASHFYRPAPPRDVMFFDPPNLAA